MCVCVIAMCGAASVCGVAGGAYLVAYVHVSASFVLLCHTVCLCVYVTLSIHLVFNLCSLGPVNPSVFIQQPLMHQPGRQLS